MTTTARAGRGRGRPLLVVLGLVAEAGCAHRGAAPDAKSVVTSASGSETSSALVELDIGSLPHGHVPPLATRPTDSARNDLIAGLYFDATASPVKLSGIKDIASAFTVDLRDDEDAKFAYCVAPTGERVRIRHGARPPSEQLPWFSVPILTHETGIRAERFEPGAEPRLGIVHAWASDTGGLRRQREAQIGLRRIGARDGVEVFAFVDDAPEGHEGPGATVNFIVRRPPLTRGVARYASFVVTAQEGATGVASCSHARVELPVARDDGAVADVDVAVETANGARRMRVHLGTIWLHDRPSAQVTARLDWHGPEQATLVVQDASRGIELGHTTLDPDPGQRF